MTNIIGIDPTVLAGWFQSFYSGTGTGVAPINTGTATTSTSSAATTQYAPTPPWHESKQPTENQLVTAALGGANIINPNAAQIDLPGAGAGYRNLFALYQGLNTLYSLADHASASNVSRFQLSQLSRAFASGLSQVSNFIDSASFGAVRVTTGTTAASETAGVTMPAQATAYDTAALNTTGDSSAVVPAFEGDVQFDVTAQKAGGASTVVHMNLADMGSTPRTIGNVVAYLNSQMSAAGAITTFSVNRMDAQPDVIQAGGHSVTVSSGQQSWGLQINTNSYETVSLSAPSTAPAVYVGQVVGNTSSTTGPGGTTVAPDAQSQLLKFQDGGAAITSPTPPAHATPDQIFADSLGNRVSSIQATQTAPDGSVYVLGDVTATASGAPATGGQDVALLKYNSTGKLLFQTDLGSASSASGLSLAVSGDGSRVAVAGQIAGPITAGQPQVNPGGANSFVAVFDSQGDQVWNHESNGVSGNQANGVAFDAGGQVYVTGQSAAGVGASLTPQGASSGYLQVFSRTGTQLSNTTFNSGGANAGQAVAVDGSDVYVAAVQNGHAVVNEYNVSSPSAPSLVASRDLGDLQGGNVAGVAVQNGTVYVAGSTRNGALAAGTVTSAYSGGLDGFAATLSTGLAASSSDAIAYYGGAGDDRVSAMTVSNGEVYLTGSSTGALPGQPQIGAQDGFAAALNVSAGTVDWSQRFTGEDGKVAPTSIAVAPTGASILDQLGLPEGVVDGPVSDLLTATTGVKAGDSFYVGPTANDLSKITVSSTDTLKTLGEKISQATGSSVSVTTATTASGVSLQIHPLDPYSTVVLQDGPSGSDALTELGLKAGILFQHASGQGARVAADGKGSVYGLGLSPSLALDSTTDISQAKSQLTAAMSVIKSAYQALKTAATPANVLALQKAQAGGSGTAPAYLTSQIASYQAALARLTGGQSSSTGISSLLG